MNKIMRFGIVFLLFQLFSQINQIQAQTLELDEDISTAMHDQDYEKALELLNKEINANSKNGVNFYYRAWLYQYAFQDNARALRDVNVAIDLFPKKEKVWSSYAYSMRGDIYLAIDEEEKGLKDYERAIKIDKKNIDFYLDRGDYFFSKKYFDRAIDDYLKAKEIDEADSKPRLGYAKVLIAQENFQAAEKELNQLLLLSPNESKVFYQKSRLNYFQKNYKEAFLNALTYYDLSDEQEDALSLLLLYAEKSKDFAIAKISEKIIKNTGKGNWYFVRARLYEENNQLDLAVKDYNKMLEMNDAAEMRHVLEYRIFCYHKGAAYQFAMADAQKLLDLDSINPYAYYARASVNFSLKEYKKAILDLDKAIELRPGASWYYYVRALCKIRAEYDSEDVLKDFSTCISLSDTYKPYVLSRGLYHLVELKDSLHAKSDFESLLVIKDTLMESLSEHVFALALTGKTKQAEFLMDSMVYHDPSKMNYFRKACLSSMKQSVDLLSNAMTIAFEHGYRDFDELEMEPMLFFYANNQAFQNYLQQSRIKYRMLLPDEQLSKKIKTDTAAYETATIPMKSKGSGVYEIDCKVNDLKLRFIFDTGASDISISQTEATFMLKNGYLSEQDIMGTQRYMDANGNISIGTRILLRKVDFGGLILKNVTASVVNNKMAPLLFGQSALSKYAKIIINNKAGEITITTKP